MSKKHFIALADALRPAYEQGELSQFALDSILEYCHQQNFRFNASRWLGYLRRENGPCGGALKPSSK